MNELLRAKLHLYNELLKFNNEEEKTETEDSMLLNLSQDWQLQEFKKKSTEVKK